MTTAKFRDRANPVVGRLREAAADLDALMDGMGEETEKTVGAAYDSVLAAVRLIDLAFAACDGEELTP